MSEHDPGGPGNGTRQTVSTPMHGFFPGGDRKTHLEQLRHLSQWSRRVLLVTGPMAIGKSTLYRQLSASLEPRAKAARVNGALVSGAREVLNALVQGFGLAAPGDADHDLLRGLVAEHAREQERSERFCIVLVDDAELVEARALDQLLGLAADTPLRLVMFGEARLVAAVERMAGPRELGWHEIRLNGFVAADVSAYLEWRFRLQGHTDRLPFSDAQLKEITRLSEGLPGRIDQMANALLARIESGALEEPRRRFPALHQALLAVLVVTIAFAYLVWRPAGKPAGTEWGEVQRLEVPPAPTPRTSGSEAARSPGSQAPQPSASEQRAPEPAGDEAARVPDEAPPAAVARTGADAPESALDTSHEDTSPPSEAASAEASAPAQTPALQPSPPDQPPPADRVAPRSSSAAAAAAGRGRPEAPESPDSGSPAEAGGATPGPAGGQPVAAESVSWIMGQPPSAFTLQLVTFSTAERASAYLAKQSDPASFARFRLQQKGRILHVVIYGSFDSRGAAERAAAALPEGVGRVEPWIRSFGQVQAAVRTALQPQ